MADDVSSADAALLIGVSSQTIRRMIARDLIPARRVGIKGLVKIDLADLRKFAKDYQYRFNETLAKELASH